MDDECLQWWWRKAKCFSAWLLQQAPKPLFVFGIAILVWGFWIAWYETRDRSEGASLMQAGAAIMSLSAMVIMPRVMKEKAKQQRDDLALRKSILIVGGFFRDFEGVGSDRKLAFPALYDTLEGTPPDILQKSKCQQTQQLINGPHQFMSARNWQFYQDAFQQLTGAQVDNMQLNSLLMSLSCAAYAMNAGYSALNFLDGNKVENILPFWQAYDKYKDSVANVRATYDALSRHMEKLHPSLSGRESNNVSEPPHPSSSQSSSSA